MRSAPEADTRFAPLSDMMRSTGATGIGVNDFLGMLMLMRAPI